MENQNQNRISWEKEVRKKKTEAIKDRKNDRKQKEKRRTRVDQVERAERKERTERRKLSTEIKR